MAYDAAPSFGDLAGQVQAGNFTTTPPATLTPSGGAPSAPASMPYDQQYGITRNPDGSIYGLPGGVSVQLAGPEATAAQQQPVTTPDTNPDRIARFLAQHPDDIGNRPQAAPQASPGPSAPPAGGPSLNPDDVQGLLGGGYSLTPGGPVVGQVSAAPQMTPGQTSARTAVAQQMQDSQAPGPLHQWVEQPLQDLLHSATFGASDAIPAAIFAGATGVRNAITRAQGGAPAFGAADAYGAMHQALQDQESDFRADHPRADLALNLGGALMSPVPLGGFVKSGLKGVGLAAKLPGLGETLARTFTSPSMAARMGRGAGTGALLGGISGALDSNSWGEVPSKVMAGTALGTAGGTLGEMAGPAISRVSNALSRRLVPQRITPEALQQAYGTLKGLGINSLPGNGQKMVEDAIRAGADPRDAAIAAAAHSLPHPIGMSRGQISGDSGQLWKEAQLGSGARGHGAEVMAKGFKAQQRQAVRDNAESIAAQLGGGRTVQPGQGGAAVSDALNAVRDAKQTAYKAAYGAAEAGGPAFLHAYDAKAVSGAVRQAVANYDLLRIPAVARELDRLQALAGNKAGIDARELFRVRARLTNLRASNDGVEASAAAAAVKGFDHEVQAAVSDGLLTGDPATIDLWRKAIGERREFGDLFQGGDLVERLTAREPRSGKMQLQVDAHDASNIILGRSALGFVGRKNLYRDLNVIKERLGPASPAWNAIRGEVFQRLADTSSRTVDGQAQIDGERFQRLWQDMKQDDPQLVRTLFSGDEQALLDRFAGISARVTRNPKNLGMVGGGGAIRQTIGRLPFVSIESLPLIGHMADKLDAAAAQRQVGRDMLRPAPRKAPPNGTGPSFAVQGAAAAQYFRQK